MVQLPVPVRLLLAPALSAGIPSYWEALLEAQYVEIEKTWGAIKVINQWDNLDRLSPPGILIIPALAGGTVTKPQWWSFCRELRAFRRRGGIVIVLLAAFCLPQEGERAAGRRFAGIETSGGENWLHHPVRFSAEKGLEGETGTFGGVREFLDAQTEPFSPAGHGFWTEHVLKEHDPHVSILVGVKDETRELPVALLHAEAPQDLPGVMLFLNTWGWRSHHQRFPKRNESVSFAAAEASLEVLRTLNQRITLDALQLVQERLGKRLERLEALSGEHERLERTMGTEKDYQRLLANDPGLCLDVLTWRSLVENEAVSTSLRTVMDRRWLWAEPPHRLAGRVKGRLDLLMIHEDEGPDGENFGALEAWLKSPDRRPVCWIELEAGAFHAHQMNTFFDQNRDLLRAGDFIGAIDRSHDTAPEIAAFRIKVEDTGIRFLHVRLQDALNQLELWYAPRVHRLLRQRFSLDLIRALVG